MAGEPIVTIVGNLTADPDLRYVGSGIPVASFTVASTPRTLNRTTNEWEDGEAMFVRCTVWREYAENVTESLTKGMRVVATGKLQVRSYQRNDGSQGTSIEMQVDEVGPSLRYATAKVERTSASARGGFGQSGYGQGGGQASYNAPAGGSAGDMWAQGPRGGSSFDDNPPF
ncbi:MAG: single-stranded DNA-binding protein [Actinomycetaceae bacterium]|nr:single-stranded DNA-binding protein [Actinomycetaceae bacterium]MDY5854406.1 single-stranded DNA-binding protein [Arcanobacterium sp.]